MEGTATSVSTQLLKVESLALRTCLSFFSSLHSSFWVPIYVYNCPSGISTYMFMQISNLFKSEHSIAYLYCYQYNPFSDFFISIMASVTSKSYPLYFQHVPSFTTTTPVPANIFSHQGFASVLLPFRPIKEVNYKKKKAAFVFKHEQEVWESRGYIKYIYLARRKDNSEPVVHR